MQMVLRIRTQALTRRNFPASTSIGISRAASVTTCRRKLHRPLPRRLSTPPGCEWRREFCLLLRASPRLRGALLFCGPGDEVGVGIAPATVAPQHVRVAVFQRAVLATPMVAILGHRAPGRVIGRRGL